MSQSYAKHLANTPISLADTRTADGFSRLRAATPASVFDSQFTYNLLTLLWESITSGSGATVTHDSTNRSALMTFASTPTGGKAYMQTFEYFRYLPGRSSEIFLTFNFIEPKANVVKFVGYSDSVNGIELQQDGSTIQIKIISATSSGNQTITRDNWNFDKFDGTGPSGKTLDFTKTQMLVIDFQALVGRVRVGFDIDGITYGAHQFLFSNALTVPYMQTANLPIRAGMTCTGTASTTMTFISAGMIASGGDIDLGAYFFTIGGTATAGNGSRTHLLSIRPKTTFKGFSNRIALDFRNLDIIAIGAQPILWEIVLGQAISGTTTFADVDTNYSGFEYNNAGTISGSPAIVLASGFVSSSGSAKFSESYRILGKMPITLDATGATRSLGTLSLLVTGLGGTSACQAIFNWREIR